MTIFHKLPKPFVLLFLIFFFLSAGVFAQSVDGDDSMEIDEEKTYSLIGGSFSNINWNVQGGSLESSNGGNQMDIKSTTGVNVVIQVSFTQSGVPGTQFRGKTVQVKPSVPFIDSEIDYLNCEPTIKRLGTPDSGITWYWQGKTNPNGDSKDLGSGSTYPITDGTGNYYLRAFNGTNWSQSSAGKYVTIPTAPSAPSVTSPTTRTICSGDTTTFNISGAVSTSTYKWYEGSTLKKTGTSFPIAPTSSTTYTVKVTDNKGCTSTAKTVQVNVTNLSTPTAGSNNSNSCTSQNSAQITAISASGFSGEHVWYTHPTNNAPTSKTVSVVTTNGQYVTGISVNSGDQKDYWVAEKIGLCISTRRQVTATFNSYAVSAGSINGSGQTLCYGGDPTTLGNQSSPTGGNGTFSFKWQISTTGVSNSWSDINSNSTSETYNPPVLQASRWYRRVATSCGISDETAAVKVTVRDELTAGGINGGGQSVCQGATIQTLSNASNPTGGDTNSYGYNWYVSNGQNGPWSSAITGATSNTFTPPSTIGTKWYRRGVTSCGDTKYTASQSVTVKPIPTAPSTLGESNSCNSNVVTLTATSSSTSVSHIWYTGASGSNTINPTSETNNGAHVSTLSVTLSGTDISYWVASEQNNCISGRTQVTATYVSTGTTPTITLVDSSTNTNSCGSGNFILTANISNGSSSNLKWYDGADAGATEVGTGSSLEIQLDYADMDNAGKKKFWIEGTLVNSGGCSFPMASREFIEVSLYQLPSTPTTTEPTVMRCGSGEVTLNANVNSGTIEWFDAPTDGNSEGTGASLTTNITQNKTFYAESVSSDGCRSATRLAVNAEITTGITWYPDGDQDNFADSTDSADTQESCDEPAGNWTTIATLDNCVGEFSTNNVVRRWYEDSDIDTLGDPAIFLDQCEQPNGYVLDSTDLCPGITSSTNDCSGGPLDPINCNNTPDLPNDPTDQNFIYTRSYQVAWQGQAPSTKFGNDDSYVQDISYFDGLGRPIQQIAIRQSPNKKDIVTHSGYDSYGRQDKNWLPFEDGDLQNPLGSFRTGDMEDATKQYYALHYADDFDGIAIPEMNPYSEQGFENSPLNRVEKQAAPGEAWKMGNDHEVEMVYSANAANEVRWFKVNLDASFVPTLEVVGNYTAGELNKTITKDENHTGTTKNYTTETFEDKQGRVLLKRNYADVDLNKDKDSDDFGEAAVKHDTYYIYDDYGNLTYVLPPLMEGSNATLTQINTDLAALGYEYRYDHRNRLVQKRILGKEWEYMVYNRLEQRVMTQDANQRESGEWLFTKYDAFGRVAYTGTSIEMSGGNPSTRTQVQDIVNDITTDLWVKQGESYTFDNTQVNYDNGAYPKTTTSQILTISYFDNYNDFTQPTGAPTSVTLLGKTVINEPNVHGLATGSKVRVLDPTNSNVWINSVTYYDDKARPIYSYSTNDYLQAIDIAETELDYVGRPKRTKTSHTKNGKTIVTEDRFTYDHVGRLLAQTQCIDGACNGGGNGSTVQADLNLSGNIDTIKVASNSISMTNGSLTDGAHLYIDPNGPSTPGDQELIVLNEYDNLGELKFKKVGGEADTNVLQSIGLQQVDYEYNVLGWMKKMNEDAIDDNDLFNFQMKYNDIADPNKQLFNGNISQTLWNTASVVNPANNPISTGYTYSYDALNRITNATDNTANENYSLDYVSYDKNGNITNLKRKGHLVANPTAATDFGVMDDLDYLYDGNQLQTVNDFDGANTGFFDGNPGGGTDYTYDDNGNMKSDGNKKITNIEYNYLNLPTKVVLLGNGKNGTIDYIYDATGAKLKKIATNTAESSLTMTEYASGYIYEGNATQSTLQFFGQGEGYVKVDGNDYKYVYQYTDHLGNVRLSYTDVNQNNTNAIDLEIVEENNYYPFGLKHIGYNGFVSTEGNDAAQRWKFGGKEYQQDMDINWYDVTARNYDPALGRWMNIDPLADQMRRHSPYNYAFDNPIYFIDADGMAPQQATDGYGNVTETSGSYWSEGSVTLTSASGTSITVGSSEYKQSLVGASNNNSGHSDSPNDVITLDIYGNVKSIKKTNDDSLHIFLNEDGDEITFHDSEDLDWRMLYKDYKVGDQVFMNVYDGQVWNQMDKAGSIMYEDGYNFFQKLNYFRASYYEYDFGFTFLRWDFDVSIEDMTELYYESGYVEGVPFVKFQNSNILYNIPDAGNFLWGYRAKLNNAPLDYMLEMANKNEGGQDTAADARAIKNGYNFKLKFKNTIYE